MFSFVLYGPGSKSTMDQRFGLFSFYQRIFCGTPTIHVNSICSAGCGPGWFGTWEENPLGDSEGN